MASDEWGGANGERRKSRQVSGRTPTNNSGAHKSRLRRLAMERIVPSPYGLG